LEEGIEKVVVVIDVVAVDDVEDAQDADTSAEEFSVARWTKPRELWGRRWITG
jgi:hypothetical protein